MKQTYKLTMTSQREYTVEFTSNEAYANFKEIMELRNENAQYQTTDGSWVVLNHVESYKEVT